MAMENGYVHIETILTNVWKDKTRVATNVRSRKSYLSGCALLVISHYAKMLRKHLFKTFHSFS